MIGPISSAGQNDLSQGDYTDTHERIANALVATASGYPPCLLTARLSKTDEQGT